MKGFKGDNIYFTIVLDCQYILGSEIYNIWK